MAISGNAPTGANLAAMIPEVWTPIVNEKNFPKSVISNFVTDLSDYIAAGGDTIHVPDLYTNSLSVSTQSTEGAEITPSVAALVDTTITVNTHKYVAWLIGDKTMKQMAAIYNLSQNYARQAQGLLMLELEDALFALWSSLSTAAVGDTSAGGLSDAQIRVALDTMDSADFNLEELAFFFHPKIFWRQLHGISKYYTDDTANLMLHADGNFGPVSDTSRGMRGALFGRPIFVSSRVANSLETYRNLLLHPSAFGFGILTNGMIDTEFGPAPIRVTVRAEYRLDFLATLAVADIIYGVGVLRADAGVVINAHDSFINS